MDVSIVLKNRKEKYLVGDIVSGAVSLTVPEGVPLSNFAVSFTAIGTVKWVEYVGTPYYGLEGNLHYDTFTYHREVITPEEVDTNVVQHQDFKSVTVPFTFTIPEDKDLPSTMISTTGSIQYSVNVEQKVEGSSSPKTLAEEKFIVQGPLVNHDLLSSVAGTAEKYVLLHGGRVAMHAICVRKGHAQGEPITVHLKIDNDSSALVEPKLVLHQVQVFSCCRTNRHKSVETRLEPVVTGKQVAAHSLGVEEVLSLTVPTDENLTIKTPQISVKYFVEIELAIPHSPDLRLNLPIVITSKEFLQAAKEKGTSCGSSQIQ